MELNEATRRLVTQAILTIRRHSPFFAAVVMFAQIHESNSMPTAATDGKDIFINPAYFASLTARQRAGLLLHEVLHAALLHLPRRGSRDALLWNIAADVVVNGMIAQQKDFKLPPNGVREVSLEHLSVEEVYRQLLINPRYQLLIQQFSSIEIDLVDVGLNGSLADSRREQLETHWRNALKQAGIVASAGQGTQPLGIERELSMLSESKIDWHAYLWRFLVRTPTDFQGFDRRQISQGYYLEALEGESVSIAVAVDTSGSIIGAEINAFMSEIQGILRSYPHIHCNLYYADASLYGPYSLSPDSPIPPPRGSGGTDFRPFFKAIEIAGTDERPEACVYLTDGYGFFPSSPPQIPTLWVITAGGIGLDELPFGEGIRLLLD
jgi:predicted metal-dependent peptidase